MKRILNVSMRWKTTQKGIICLLMDWDVRNEKGTEPARSYIETIRSLQNLEQMTEYFINSSISPQTGSLFRYAVSTSFEDPDSRMLEIMPPVLSMEDAAEYRNMTENGRIKKTGIRLYGPSCSNISVFQRKRRSR